MTKPTYEELTALLARSHEKLENITDENGCTFHTAIVLVDCENALKSLGALPKRAASRAAKREAELKALVNVH
jgi:hypothetical protein